MLKSTALAAFSLLTLSGAAYAGDYHRNLAFQPTGPQPIMDIVEVGGGTVAGTVGTVSEMWFVLNDGEMEIPVTGDGFLPEGIRSGDQITVIGGIWQGAIQADQIIRQDGTAFGAAAGKCHHRGRKKRHRMGRVHGASRSGGVRRGAAGSTWR